MIFYREGVKCAFSKNTISHKGGRTLFKLDEVLSIENQTYKVIKIEKSAFMDTVINVYLKEMV